MSTHNDQINSFENDDFASMLEESFLETKSFEPGDQVEGQVINITNDLVYIDISGKSEAIIDTNEFRTDDNALTITMGDTISAYIVSDNHSEITLTSMIGKGFVTSQLLRKAYTEDIEVYGTVAEKVQSGFTINVADINCFCPFSQIDMRKNKPEEEYLHKIFAFKILEYKENGRNIIVSRRALLEKGQQTKEAEIRASLQLGDIMPAKVLKVEDFGVFVDLGGLDALIPKSELSYSRSVKPDDFKIGQIVNGKVISLDWENRKFALSIKQTQAEPWQQISRFSVDQTLNGIVTNIIMKGAFVEIAEGLEGFVPISKMSMTKRIQKPEDVVAIGDPVSVKILQINHEQKRITLQLLTGEADPWLEEMNGLESEKQTAIVESVTSGGITVRLTNGMLGFLPRGEIVAQHAEMQHSYPTGKEISVLVKEIDRTQRKLIVSEKEVIQQEEKKEFSKYSNTADTENSTSSLGAMFRDVFENVKNNISS